MLIAIISDVHNNIVNLKKVLDFCAKKKIKKIICCGDLASADTLDFFCDNFSGEIHYTFGNMDNDFLRDCFSIGSYVKQTGKKVEKCKNTKIYQSFGEIELEKKRVAFVHFPDFARELAQSGKYNFVFYGHTHKPWIEKVNDCTLLNPGNVAGEIYLSTFAVWNTKEDKFELVRIHNLE